MNSLIGYGSSDEEDGIQPEKPAKIAKTTANAPPEKSQATKPILETAPKINTQASAPQPQAEVPLHTDNTLYIDNTSSAPGPSAGPPPAAAAPQQEDNDAGSFSPYTFERQRLRELTMPTVPNFEIPNSPPPPSRNSEEAAALAATTKKFERFLELKKQGVHFNERLQNSSSLRNPSLLPKLMEFAGISQEDSYRSSLPEEVAVAVKWPEECYVEGLLRQNEKREKKRVAERDKVDFVPAIKAAGSSKEGTPPGGGGGERRSRFDKK